MKHPHISLLLAVTAALVLAACPVHADDRVLYQTSFATNPQWTTNNPSSDYWDQGEEMYHFKIEPSTGNYAYSPKISYDGGSFSFGYDVILEQVGQDATFRMGFSGTEMDFNQGPNVVTEFFNGKYGQTMGLLVVTSSSKMSEVTSYTSSYGGPTVRYEFNTTYHVQVEYNAETNIVTETVTNKATGNQVWSYYVTASDGLKDMKRIYLGSVGDYGSMGRYAVGWIDNVRLTSTEAVPTTVVTTTQPVSTMPTYSLRPTTKATTTVPLTPIPTATKKSPVPVTVILAALGIAGSCAAFRAMNKKR